MCSGFKRGPLPDGKPLVAAWDRPVFYIANPDVFPNVHGPDKQRAIVMGWALDYAATDPTFIVGLMNWWGVEKSGYSTDGGKTWKSFAEYPPGIADKIGGGIAASTLARRRNNVVCHELFDAFAPRREGHRFGALRRVRNIRSPNTNSFCKPKSISDDRVKQHVCDGHVPLVCPSEPRNISRNPMVVTWPTAPRCPRSRLMSTPPPCVIASMRMGSVG